MTSMIITGVINNTKRDLKALKSIIVFFTSNIGPITMKAKRAPGLKLFAKEAAIKASADEHTETAKANTSMIKIDASLSWPIPNNRLRGMKVWAMAPRKAPMIKYLPISKNSSQDACRVLQILDCKGYA